MQKEIARVLIVALEARRRAARGYVLNEKMKIEVSLLSAEIEALEEIIQPVKIKEV